MSKKGGLGRGLSSIISETEQAYEKSLKDNSGLVVDLDIRNIVPNPMQPRKDFKEDLIEELAHSIEEYGLLQPILVYERNDGQYVIIAGERRYRAYKFLNRTTIQAIIVTIDKEQLQQIALIENIQREDLNPIELAHAYKELIERYGLSHDKLAQKLAKSRVQITNTLRLLELSPTLQKWISEGKLSHGHAKVLASLSESEQHLIANSIIGQKLSVRETEDIVKKIKSSNEQNTENPPIPQKPRDKKEKESINIQKLTDIVAHLKQNNIQAKSNKNRLVVEFRNELEWEKFIKILSTSTT